MTTIKSTSYRGKQLLSTARHNVGFCLTDVYKKPSHYKEKAWERCFSQFASDDTSKNFRIISYNTFGFSVAWETEQGTRIETPKNSYLITNV